MRIHDVSRMGTWLVVAVAVLSGSSIGCAPSDTPPPEEPAPVVQKAPAAADSEGVRRIPITTPSGTFEVWTKKLGDNPTMKVLLLHGGPGMTHEYVELVAEKLSEAGIEAYLYDQLGSYYSDQPDDSELWRIPRFVDEVEQVRQALGLGPDNFYLWGHSWGGILAIEYALAHGDALKGLIISNMVASIPEYNRYAEEVLKPQMNPQALAEIEALEAAGDYENPRYMELLMGNFYVQHILRRPPDEWPPEVMASLEHVNPQIYVLMQGPSELGLSGRLENWDRSADLAKIETPTLVIGARYDTMDPAYMEWMASQFPNGEFLYCPNGSHLAFYDDTETYMNGLIRFINKVNEE